MNQIDWKEFKGDATVSPSCILGINLEFFVPLSNFSFYFSPEHVCPPKPFQFMDPSGEVLRGFPSGKYICIMPVFFLNWIHVQIILMSLKWMWN